MTNRILIVASIFMMMALASVRLRAQASYVEGRIPFSFGISDKTLPAGEYRMVSAAHQVKIEDGDGKALAIVLANDIEGGSASAKDRIVFHCYRDRCFLAEVWSGTAKGRQVLTSRAEGELAREEQARYFAVLGQKPRN